MNVKRIYRLYPQEGLMVRRLKRKRLVRTAPVNTHLTGANQEWALDFVCDALATGRGLRILTIVDSFTRECPAIEVNTGLSGQRVTRVLEQVIYKWRNTRRTLAPILANSYTTLVEDGRAVSRDDIRQDVSRLFRGNFEGFCKLKR